MKLIENRQQILLGLKKKKRTKQRNKRNWVIFDTDAKQSYEIKVYGYLSLEKFFVGYLFSLPNFKSSAAPDC